MTPTYIDLFAGCGGFSCGLEMAGFEGVLHLESDEWACETLAANFSKSSVLCADIRQVPTDTMRRFEGVDVIVGGPPCQGFSVAGTSQFGVYDPRNELVLWFLRWVEVVRPMALVLENVPGILTKRDRFGKTVPQVVQERLGPLGYSVRASLLNAAAFGVPQLRTRAFIVCERDMRPIEDPSPTHELRDAFTVGSLFEASRPAYVSVGEAISDLPAIQAGEGAEEGLAYATPPVSHFQSLVRGDTQTVSNHVAMRHTQRLVERFATIGEEQSLKDVHSDHGQLRYRSGDINPTPYKYNNYRLSWSRPALTIPASFQSLFLHPKLNRNLTAREAARLMSFPDRFKFRGKRTTMSWEKHLSQYNQIGNAVCPMVAQALGHSIKRWLEQRTTAQKSAAQPPLSGQPDQSGAFRRVFRSPVGRIEESVLLELSNAFFTNENIFGSTYRQPIVMLQGLAVPTVAFPLALLVMTQETCLICNSAEPPNGCHLGEMPFLISKDETHSLELNLNDHGLDYHIRSLLGLEYQVGHVIGESLAEHGFGELAKVVNPRTGRVVRGIRCVSCPGHLEDLREKVFPRVVAAQDRLVDVESSMSAYPPYVSA